MLDEAIKNLAPAPGEFFIDATIDGGGHAQAILSKIGPSGMLLGLDWDQEVLSRARARFQNDSNVLLEHANYATLKDLLKKKDLPRCDALLVDLGFSSDQLEISGRGFSFQKDEPLLMTYDESATPVWKILQKKTEKELAAIIRDFSQERQAAKIARAIKNELKNHREIKTTKQLADLISKTLGGRSYEAGRIHPATRTFQALRIYANGELANLETLLESLPSVVRPGGRLAIITFHSLEDAIVKHKFQALAKSGVLFIDTKKPLEPALTEVYENPRSRSAKLRLAHLI